MSDVTRAEARAADAALFAVLRQLDTRATGAFSASTPGPGALPRSARAQQQLFALASADRLDGLVDAATSAATSASDGSARAARAAAEVARALLLQRDIHAVTAALTRAGIPHALWKGAVLDARFFGGLGRRGFSDIDVVVAPGAVAAATSALAPLELLPLDLRDRPVSASLLKGLTLVPASPVRLGVDLHARLVSVPPYRAVALPPPVVVDTAIGALPTLPDALHVAALAGNLGAGQVKGRHKLALDAWCLWRQPDFSVPALFAWAAALGVSRPLFGLARLVHARFGCAVGEGVAATLAPGIPLWQRAWIDAVFGVHDLPSRPASRTLRALWVDAPLADARWWGPRLLLHKGVAAAGDRLLARRWR